MYLSENYIYVPPPSAILGSMFFQCLAFLQQSKKKQEGQLFFLWKQKFFFLKLFHVWHNYFTLQEHINIYLCLPFQQKTVPDSPLQTLRKESHLLTVRCAVVGRSVNRQGVNKRGTVKGTLLTIQNYTVKIKQAAFFVPIFHPRGMYKKEGLKNVVKLFLKEHSLISNIY